MNANRPGDPQSYFDNRPRGLGGQTIIKVHPQARCHNIKRAGYLAPRRAATDFPEAQSPNRYRYDLVVFCPELLQSWARPPPGVQSPSTRIRDLSEVEFNDLITLNSICSLNIACPLVGLLSQSDSMLGGRFRLPTCKCGYLCVA